ncbi:response regulator [Candidatus Neomarinimicrobiota bacterium]
MVLNLDSPIEIRPGIYWVGSDEMEGGLHCNPYLIVDKDEAVLLDPGSGLDFEEVYRKVLEVVSLDKIKYIVLHHQDPDLCSSVTLFEEKGLKAEIVTHWRSAVILKFYGIKSPYYLANEKDFALKLGSGRSLQFIPTPYLHFPGAIVTYDEESRILFSSDLFGAFSTSWELYAGEDYLEPMKLFHENYMPGNDVLRPVMESLMGMDISLIAPQHGSIIADNPRVYIEALRDLECGAYLNPIKKELTKSGGFLGICNQILKRYYSVFGLEEVLEIFSASEIELDDKTHLITDFNSTGQELWNDLFQIVYSKKGLGWISVIESLVSRIVIEYDVEYPSIFESIIFDIDKKAQDLSEENKKLKDLNKRLVENLRNTESKLTRCPITDLYNESFFHEYLADEVASILQRGETGSLIHIEIDNMSSILFEFGDKTSQDVLKGLAYLILQEKSSTQTAFRREGPVFAYYAAGLGHDEGKSLAEKIRNAITSTDIFITPVSVSLGVVSLDEFENIDKPDRELASMIANVASMRSVIARRQGANLVCSTSSLEEYTEQIGKILIVDTDETNIDILRTALEANRFEVITCRDGEEAIQVVHNESPHIIIAEYMVPKLDGLGIRRQLMTTPGGASIPFILLSLQKNEDLIRQAAHLQIEFLIKKPFFLSEIVGIVKTKLISLTEK